MKKVALFLSIILIISLINVSFATNLYDDKNTINNSIEEEEKKVEEIEEKKAEVQDSIFVVAQKKETLINSIKKTEEDINKKQAELDVIQKDLEKAGKRIKKQEDDFSKRVKAMYERSNESTLEIFFKSDGISDFMNRLDFARAVAKQDKEVLDSFKEEKERIKKLEEVAKSKLAELNALKDQQVKDKAELVAVEKELEERAAELQAEIDKQKQVISDKRAELDGILEQIRVFEAEQERLRQEKEQREREERERKQREEEERKRQEEEQAENDSDSESEDSTDSEEATDSEDTTDSEDSSVTTSRSSGSWVWPLPGEYYISSYFGMRYHPILEYYYQHDGLDIPGDSGEPIVAASDGVVVDAGWMGSYGNAVIISHGDGISTIYAHASVLYVSAGQSVSAGECFCR